MKRKLKDKVWLYLLAIALVIFGGNTIHNRGISAWGHFYEAGLFAELFGAASIICGLWIALTTYRDN